METCTRSHSNLQHEQQITFECVCIVLDDVCYPSPHQSMANIIGTCSVVPYFIVSNTNECNKQYNLSQLDMHACKRNVIASIYQGKSVKYKY